MMIGPGKRWMLNRPLPATRDGDEHTPRLVRIPKASNDNGPARDWALTLKLAATIAVVSGLLVLALWRSQVFF